VVWILSFRFFAGVFFFFYFGYCFTTCLQLMLNYFLLKEPKLVQFVIATEQHAT